MPQITMWLTTFTVWKLAFYVTCWKLVCRECDEVVCVALVFFS